MRREGKLSFSSNFEGCFLLIGRGVDKGVDCTQGCFEYGTDSLKIYNIEFIKKYPYRKRIAGVFG